MSSLKKPVQEFTHFLLQRNIAHVVICPGSRNAPFIIDLANHSAINTYSIVDERSAAFFALGIAQQSGRPAVVISTSGTAALNFAPALAEAYYQRIPLIAVTGDRPEEWIDQGEGQSIRQKDVFTNFCKGSFDLGHDFSDTDRLWYFNRQLNEAFAICDLAPKGPIHLNFQLRESLYETTSDRVQTRFIEKVQLNQSLSIEEIESAVKELSSSKRILVLAGQLNASEDLSRHLSAFASLGQVVVFTETHSNLHAENFVSTIDRWIMGAGEMAQLIGETEILITIGTNIISRKIKEILRKSAAQHWHIDEGNVSLDTFRKLSRVYPVLPKEFFCALNGKVLSNGSFAKEVLEINQGIAEKASRYLTGSKFSDLSAIHSVLNAVPSGYDIQMGNSSIVRYFQLYDSRSDLTYFGNRGVSGIDGCTSTAIGASFISEKPTLLVSGDLAFLYDSNAFWNKHRSENLKIVVVNNGGGGIFRIIDGPSSTDALEQYFETVHNRTAASLCASFNVPCHTVINESELPSALQKLFESRSLAVLEIHTPRLENDGVLKNFFSAIKFLKPN